MSSISYLLHFFLGVPLFFFLSGFLIWISIDKYKNTKNYYINRFLRIYPELWMGILVEATCLIMFVTHINLKDIVLFTATQATIFQFWTPNSLRSFGCGVPNGSLWTICIMIQFYIVVWPLKKFCHEKKISFWVIVEITLMLIGTTTKYVETCVPEIMYKLYCQTIIPYMWLFGLGILLAEYKEEILPALTKYWYVSGICAIGMSHSPIDIWAKGFPIIFDIFCIITWIGVAYRFTSLKVKIDISYPLFIYHMIVVNVIIELGHIEKNYALIASILISLMLAVFSTLLIGKNVAKLKV